jgi:hypothetical protein
VVLLLPLHGPQVVICLICLVTCWFCQTSGMPLRRCMATAAICAPMWTRLCTGAAEQKHEVEAGTEIAMLAAELHHMRQHPIRLAAST